MQNIISYTDIPKPSIVIRGIPSDLINKNESIILDTINQLSNKSNFSVYYILAILNSKLISWYIYRFIYGKAIMTMHFDSVITVKIPMPSIDLSKKSDKEIHDKLANLVYSIIGLNKKFGCKSKWGVLIMTKTNKTKGILYLLAIAIMVALMSIACKNNLQCL